MTLITAMHQETLKYLMESDWQLLLDNAELMVYEKGETILAQGSQRQALFLLVRGYASIESSHADQGIYLNQIGPGEIFGEISFLEDRGATASVIAVEQAQVQVISAERLGVLLTSVSGLASRFYQSLALTLAQRLRQVIDRMTTLAEETAVPDRFPPPPLATQDQPIPENVLHSLQIFREQLLQIETQLKAQHLTQDEGKGQVGRACDDLLNAFARPDSPLSDPDFEQATRLGEYLLREAFPLLMRSLTIATCHRCGRRYGNDYQIGELIMNSRARGEGELGVMIDAWFLARPFCTDYRHGSQILSSQILNWALSANPALTRITSLACGNSREVLDLWEQGSDLNLFVTCLDPNPAALAYNAQTYRQLGLADRMTFLQNDIRAILQGQESLALPPQQIIYGFTLCDRWNDQDVITLLNWIYQGLVNNGVAILSSCQPNAHDRLLLDHILNWELRYRTQEDWKGLVRGSRFDLSQLSFLTETTQSFQFPVIKKT